MWPEKADNQQLISLPCQNRLLIYTLSCTMSMEVEHPLFGFLHLFYFFVVSYNHTILVPSGRKVLHGSARRNCILRVGGFPSSSTHCCNRQPTIMIFFVDCSKYKMWE